MGIKDLIITPIYFILLSGIAFVIRPYVASSSTKKYFLPALWIKFFGAIALGLIYQFWYGGGDTLNYFSHGSKWIWEALIDSPIMAYKMFLLDSGNYATETFQYASKIWYFRDPESFLVVKITALFDLFTMHTYSSTALFYAAFSFSGSWALYDSLYKKYGSLKYLEVAILFIPSVVFWGSGILKDSITLGAIGWLLSGLIKVIDTRERVTLNYSIIFLASILIFSVKSYIIICLIPPLFMWLYLRYLQKIRGNLVRFVMAPVLASLFLGGALLTTNLVSTDIYSVESFAQKAAITSYDIRYGWGARTGGDGGFDIGIPDGSIQSLIRLMPAAINVSLFRPYLWEVRNPLMLLSALESSLILFVFVRVIYMRKIGMVLKDPFLVFCFLFSVLFAFAIGVSTSNFGTLIRYKIPLLPLFSLVLFSTFDRNYESKC